jgi:uncharacterized protein with von Willebrand factor type A (vWA) domain
MAAPSGKLADNVLRFVRVLRAAGLPLGPGAALDALEAAAAIDLSSRVDFRAALAAALVKRREERAIFDEAFGAFFRDPLGAEAALALLLPPQAVAERGPSVSRRVAEALRPQAPAAARRADEAERGAGVELDAALTWSEREVLRQRDFAEMTAEELARARAAVARIPVLSARVPSRRLAPDPRATRVDLRATLRASLRGGGRDIPLRFRSPREVVPPLVVLCDISGSMARYSEMLLRFVHAIAGARGRVHAFVFGTRLTNITRALRFRDVDSALARVGREVVDWSGGTRIGASLREFNRAWSRRVLAGGAVVLLVTDGLEREDAGELALEASRLQRSCRRLLWLNPLLGFAGFEPRAAGIRALLPHVDELRPVHDLESLEQLAAALGDRPSVDTPAARAAAAHHARVRRLHR